MPTYRQSLLARLLLKSVYLAGPVGALFLGVFVLDDIRNPYYKAVAFAMFFAAGVLGSKYADEKLP
jgi:hypothetical protein